MGSLSRALGLAVLCACGRLGFPEAPATGDGGGPPDELGLSLDATVQGDGIAATATCGTNVLLTDGFDVAGEGPTFTKYTDSGLTLQEVGGRFEVVFSSSVGDGRYSGYKAVTGYPPDGLCASVRVLQIPASNGLAFFKLTSGVQQVELITFSGKLSVRTHQNKQVASLLMIPYDTTAHAYWRIRHQGITTYWDVSSDGVAYVELASTVFLTDPSVKYEIGAGSFGNSSNAGLAAFDDALLLGP